MIVPVKKVQLFVVEEEKEQLLKLIQKHNLIMTIDGENTIKEDIAYEDAMLLRVNSAIKYLQNIREKKPFFDYQEATYEALDDRSDKYNKLLLDIEEALGNLSSYTKELKSIEESIVLYQPFKENTLNLLAMSKTKYTTFYHGFIYEKTAPQLKEFLEKHEIPYQFFAKGELGIGLTFAVYKETAQTYYQEIRRFDFKEIDLPVYDGIINEYLLNLYQKKTKMIELVNQAVKHIESFTNKLDLLYIYADQLASDKARKLTPIKKVSKRMNVINVAGWVRADQEDTLRNILEKSDLGYEIEVYNPEETETPPTALKNNKFVENFEIITEQYSPPNHKELDPNPAMSFWYWLMFGMMMGDVGYGLLMLLGFGLFLKLKKPKGGMKKLVGVLYYSGYTTIFFGILYGSLFGFDFDIGKLVGMIFGQSWSTVLLTPINNALEMLIYALVIGLIHIIHGLILKAIILFKIKDPLGALAESFSYILILLGLGLYALTMVSLPFKLSPWFSYVFIIVGTLFLVVFMGRNKGGILAKITSSLSGIYAIIGQLSDILSYSRILALSLSSAVIAYTFNLLAGMLQGNIVGILFSIIIYIVGHIFNFAMGMLSAYIHNSRLQYIEFFGKFYEGGGYLFTPLGLELNYLNEVKNIKIVGGV